MKAQELEPHEELGAALAAALELGCALGPGCERALARPRTHLALLLRLGAGVEPLDAVVSVLCRGARRDGGVANELLRDVLPDLVYFGKRVLPPHMRRLHDADDLVVSVLGDCFGELFAVPVEGRGHLIGLLEKRIRWKSMHRSRGMATQRRSDEVAAKGGSCSLDDWSAGPSPLAQAAAREELQKLARRLRALSGRDRKVLALHLAQYSPTEIAGRVGLSRSGAQRAIRRLLGAGAAP